MRMRVIKGIVIGVIYGFVLSFCSALLFMLIAQSLAGGITVFWGENWLYFATIVPFIITFSILGYYLSKQEKVTNKKLWLLSLLSAFFITLYSGTIGAIFGEYIVRGSIETINIDGTLKWGTIYAFVLLPLTASFGHLIIHFFYMLLNRLNISN
ncbi:MULTISPECIES: hypothetical protein [Anoxybacillaceae]|jgi:hypothetical protein|uniref:hypothetical protein n=1 Tax=Anoxybacillaceae TaxID=3120669 RepID=UPI001915534F|nr:MULTISPECIES: hypothetical protein [Anoxybacillus]MBS2773186.1 hypothetical protein [Anoxybacillus rupiensis]